MVAFDCDSTLCAIEGIEVLARASGTSVSELTDAVMRGEIPMDAIYAKRLALVQPRAADVARLERDYVAALVPDAREVVRALHGEGIEVRVISAGVRQAVTAVAAELGIAPGCVAAVDVKFDDAGAYASFDETSPLTRAFGKRDLLRMWRRERNTPVMMVGDGATDLEAADVVDVFVAYAGVIEREEVTARGDVVIRSPSLAPILPLALGGARPKRAESRELFDKGLALLESEYRSYLPFARTE